LKAVFPKLPSGWFDVLERMIDEEGFTNQRLIDATKQLIRTCEFPEPSLARIIGFDRSVKIHTYNDLLTIAKDYSPMQRKEFLESFEKVNHYGELRYCKKDEIIKFNLPKWEKK
jgi:hypothetical protein